MSNYIMIVDDDIDDIDIFIEAAKEVEPDMRYVVAQNGAEALATIHGSAEKPGYIFADLNMPKVNGRQLSQELRKDPSFDDVKIIIYSTRELFSEERKALPGVDAFVIKPTSKEELCRTIARIINMKYPVA